MLLLLKLPPSSPPSNALAARPDIARMIGLYAQVKNLGALPDEGGLLDQRADYYAYFAIFSAAESEHIYAIQQG
jgi:hypothetical protein